MTELDRELGLAEIFVALSDSLRGDQGIVDTFDLLVEASTSYSAAIEAGVVLGDAAGQLHVIASSSERTTDVEEAQLGTKAGPCFESYHGGAVVDVSDIRTVAGKWPDFHAAALKRGFVACY